MTTVPGPSERLMRGDSRGRRLVILRHGQTTHNAAGIWQGQYDAPLSPVGIDQAAAAAPALARYDPVCILSSDLQRAARTADAAARVLGLPVCTDPRLREIDVGAWSGLTTAEVGRRWPQEQAALARGEDIPRGESGETVAQVAERGHAALADLLDGLDDGRTALVVTHGVAGRAMAAQLTGVAQHVAWLALAGLGNCHWVTLGEGRHGWRIEEWNAHA